MKQNHFRILLSCLLLLCLVWAMPGQARAAGGAYIEGEKSWYWTAPLCWQQKKMCPTSSRMPALRNPAGSRAP